MRAARTTIVITITAATAITTTPSTIPTVQPVTWRALLRLGSRHYSCDSVVSRRGGAYDRTTMKRSDLARRADELTAAREPFVTALVVRAQRPSSVTAGDSAIVHGDGTIEGFVGGACA